MLLRLTTSVIYNGRLWSVGSMLEVADEHADMLRNYGEVIEETAVNCGEKTCVERDESEAPTNKPTPAPAKKARSNKKK